MRNKLMKRKKKEALPVWTAFLLAAGILACALRLSGTGSIPEKIVKLSCFASMPDCAVNQWEDWRAKTLLLIQNGFSSGDIIFQKSGTLNEEPEETQDEDFLTQTPDDILQSMRKVQLAFEEGLYPEDGEIVEKTFLDNQATDTYNNVYVRNVTQDSTIDLEKIIREGCSLPIGNPAAPSVLIYHTHSTESYVMNDNGKFSSLYPSRSDDKSLNMIRVGEEIASVLEARGIGVIHDREIYDSVYTGAYDVSREGVLDILKQYPTICITLDIHRDAVYYDDTTRLKVVTERNGKKAAQMMIIAGAQGGTVTDFASWETNLSFAVLLQKMANEKYENLMKPIYFCNRKYNMDVTPYSLLIEIGTDVNTLEEAAYSGRLLGDVLSDFIEENAKETEK